MKPEAIKHTVVMLILARLAVERAQRYQQDGHTERLSLAQRHWTAWTRSYDHVDTAAITEIAQRLLVTGEKPRTYLAEQYSDRAIARLLGVAASTRKTPAG